MKIAVCDDSPAARNDAAMCIEDYADARNITLTYEMFEHYAPLKSRVDEFDVFIVDYQMPEIDGMTFAAYIRAHTQKEKTIIFITSFSEIVYDAFAVRAHRFLCKPIDKEKFFEAMDACLHPDGQTGTVIIKSGGISRPVAIGDILFIEVQRKECAVHTQSETLLCKKTIAAFEQALAGCGFFRVHRAYLVNLKQLRQFDSHTAVFANGAQIAVSPRRYQALCREYLKQK